MGRGKETMRNRAWWSLQPGRRRDDYSNQKQSVFNILEEDIIGGCQGSRGWSGMGGEWDEGSDIS